MTYKGYADRIGYSGEDGCFVGHIAGIRDIVSFHGESVAELRAAFEEAVDDYLETCEKLGSTPQKPYSGQLTLHIPPEVHASVAIAAETKARVAGPHVGALSEITSDRRGSIVGRAIARHSEAKRAV